MRVYPNLFIAVGNPDQINAISDLLNLGTDEEMARLIHLGLSSLVRALTGGNEMVQFAYAHKDGKQNIVMLKYPVPSDGLTHKTYFDKDKGLPYIEVGDTGVIKE